MHSVGDSDGAETMKRPDNNTHLLPHTCDRCGKLFASGRALGGHRTVHDRNTRHRLSAAAAASLADSIACPVCGVKFASRKSVYGHMRAHRHRGWRGMKPPAAAQVISPPSSTVSEISSDLREKAASVRERIPNTAESTQNAVRKSRRNRKTRRLADLEPKSAGAAVVKNHVSRICGVSFPTFYALGGHASVHNRTKNNNNLSSCSRKNKKEGDDKLEDSNSMIRGCSVKKLHYLAEAAVAGSVLKFDLNELPPIEDDDEEI